MISKCQTVTVAKKKFSDFEYVSSIEGIYLVGYAKDIDETGAEYTYNIRIPASEIFKRTDPVVYDSLNPCGSEGYDTVEVDGKVVFIFDTENMGTFIQLNNIDNALDLEGYLHIALNTATAPGTRVDFVVTASDVSGNFSPARFKGIKLHSGCGAASGEVYTDTIYDREGGEYAPLYVSLLQLAAIGNMPPMTMCTNVAVNMESVEKKLGSAVKMPPASTPTWKI